MGLISATIKAICKVISNKKFHRDSDNAQKKAFNYACKKAGNQYDPNWDKNYRKGLKKFNRKAENDKIARDTFFDNF